jgi:O-antigen/teichoic acid export membrane protein
MFCLIAPATVNGVMKTNGLWPLALLTVATLAAGILQTCQFWSIRVKAFKQTSAAQVIRSVTSNGTKIFFGYYQVGAMGLIASQILADISASVNLIRVLLPDFRALRGNIKWGRLRRVAKNYRDFPIFSASQNVTNALSVGLPVLLITHYYGIAAAGAYAFAGSVLQVPMGFILTALRQVLFQKACETQHRGESLATLYIRMTAFLFVVVIFPSLVLLIWAPRLFTWIFGAQWHLAGILARSLIVWFAVSFCNLPAILFAKIVRIQRFVFVYDLFLLAARLSALVIGGMYLSVAQTVTIFALIGAAMNSFLIFKVGRVVLTKEGQANLESLKESLTSGLSDHS